MATLSGMEEIRRIGQRIGPYRIEGFLGSGGMGVVYLARDPKLRRTVAIKIVDPSKHDRNAPHLLVREARLAAALSHPSICSIHEIGQLGDDPFIVMEHVKGTTLAAILEERGGLPFETALHYQMQIVDAVAHAHDREIVHGDLKSSNVMVEPDGRIKILDFGLAVQRIVPGARQASAALTTAPAPPTSCAGTVPYMAPELLRGREPELHSDIWAMGVLFFEMLAGSRPFRGGTTYELAAAILGNEQMPLSRPVPGAVRQLIGRCLLTRPSDRYPTARHLAVALDDLR
jgi:serine/threonine protein kinase